MTHAQLLPVPPLDTATKSLSSQRWRAFTASLEFGSSLLDMSIFGPARRLMKTMRHVPAGPQPRPRTLKGQVSAPRNGPGMRSDVSVAVLWTGPGM